MEKLDQVDILTRREIEALIAGPLIRAFMDELGREKALEIVKPLIEKLAEESGRAAAKRVGGDSIDHFATAMEAWSAGDAYRFNLVQQTEEAYDWDVTHCAYADMYCRLGLADLGFHLSCARDFAMVQGFNPKMRLARTKTCMQGDDICDFRLRLNK